MKKLLLLVLTVVMVMCVAVFGAGAAKDCGDSNHTLDRITVPPACEVQGYDIVYCVVCGKEIAKDNYTKAEEHIWSNEYIAANDSQGDYYKNRRTCLKEKCGKTEIETKVVNGNTVDVRYYLVQFFNAKVTGGYLAEYTLDSGKKIDIKHAKLADTSKFKTVPLCKDEIYVRENGSYTYDGELPRREKDVNAGAYNFVGWTSNVSQDTDFEPEIATVDSKNPSVNNYETTIENINRNTTYFACWESVKDVTYSVQFMNSNGESWISPNNGQMQIPHGGTINYIWVYPTRKSTVSSDFVFTGWGCGDTAKKDSYGNYTQYDEYMLADNIHIKEIPIFSDDAFVAIHAPQTRIYKAQFNLNKDLADHANPIIANVGFGEALRIDKNNKLILAPENVDNYSSLNESDFIIKDEYRDNTYIYQFENSFITSGGHEIKSGSFSVPQYSVDADDAIYIERFVEGATEINYFTLGGEKVVFDQPGFENGTFFDLFEEELEYYNYCMDINNETVYEGRYFDLSKNAYYFPISEHETYLFDDNGNRIALEVSFKGIYKVDMNGGRSEFTREDAEELRLIKVEPEYRSIVRLYPFTVEVVFPIVLNGKTLELLPEDYVNTLVVQVKNENGQSLARGYTGTKVNGKSFDIVTDKNGNKYYHTYCTLAVQQAEVYQISVASTDEKYEGKRDLYWSVYSTMYDSGNNKMKTNVLVDASIRDGYNQSVNCYCLCHGPLKGLWERILNLLYSLFKIKYECCPHMHAELSGLIY